MMRENGAAAVAYYRVSTRKQEASGLGLEAQETAVKRYAARNELVIKRTFTEVETGTRKRERPELAAAIRAAKEADAVLLIAKLDRLARNVHFVSGLMESGVRFTAVDMPQVDNLTIHILAAVAEQEAKLISQRTKAALAAAKARGIALGNEENLTYEAQAAGARRNRETAVEAYRPITGYVKVLYDSGMGHGAIARRLNEEGHRTRWGKRFYAMTVYRILERVGTA